MPANGRRDLIRCLKVNLFAGNFLSSCKPGQLLKKDSAPWSKYVSAKSTAQWRPTAVRTVPPFAMRALSKRSRRTSYRPHADLAVSLPTRFCGRIYIDIWFKGLIQGLSLPYQPLNSAPSREEVQGHRDMAPSILNLDTQQTLQQLWPLCLTARLRTKFDNVVRSLFGLS